MYTHICVYIYICISISCYMYIAIQPSARLPSSRPAGLIASEPAKLVSQLYYSNYKRTSNKVNFITVVITDASNKNKQASNATLRPLTSQPALGPYYRRKSLTIERNPLLYKEIHSGRAGWPSRLTGTRARLNIIIVIILMIIIMMIIIMIMIMIMITIMIRIIHIAILNITIRNLIIAPTLLSNDTYKHACIHIHYTYSSCIQS